MKYMCLIYSTPDAGPQPGTPEFGAYLGAYQEFTKLTEDRGAFISGEALQPIQTATTVTRENGKLETTDGPFAETKEVLGGYYVLECKDLDDAIDMASKIPTAEHGRIEVRPVMVFDD